MDFNTAANYAKNLEFGGKKDFRVPSKEELNVLFENREKGALKGTFNLDCWSHAGYYWSSTCAPIFNYSYAHRRRFGDGGIGDSHRREISSVRCVR